MILDSVKSKLYQEKLMKYAILIIFNYNSRILQMIDDRWWEGLEEEIG